MAKAGASVNGNLYTCYEAFNQGYCLQDQDFFAVKSRADATAIDKIDFRAAQKLAQHCPLGAA